MDRDTELQLIDELLDIKANKTFYLDEHVTKNPVSHYIDQSRFDLEREAIFRKLPLAVIHSSELAEPGSFLRKDIADLPVLLTRDKQGQANAFLNVCRHRGTRLVDADSGCQHRFTCPYHAWTYASDGKLLSAPHFKDGFTGADKSDFGLKRLPCKEQFGFIWVTADADGEADISAYLDALAPELDALNMDDLYVAHEEVVEYNANWKILVEGGIEAYHFKVAHRDTIGPFFEDNLSSYRTMGPHMRSILMRTNMAELDPAAREEWRIRDNAQVLYLLFPATSLLVQSDHIAWIQPEPIGPDRTRMRLVTLAPKAESERTEHWARNHQITSTTLAEDFVIGEAIQASLASGANDVLTFGRFEGALHAFNRVVDGYLDGKPLVAEAAE